MQPHSKLYTIRCQVQNYAVCSHQAVGQSPATAPAEVAGQLPRTSVSREQWLHDIYTPDKSHLSAIACVTDLPCTVAAWAVLP